ncbi:diaminopimelate decarboxylase [Granulicella sp. dw_53]|uniref:diaminopimelate decarboxylase n=1 Tax=Granulicella sp. dw_53 TaxID=2719792 RepID=UPI001BD459C9|nr:diaminopimelate decarboxylase [Granulicella sp. dw_53]
MPKSSKRPAKPLSPKSTLSPRTAKPSSSANSPTARPFAYRDRTLHCDGISLADVAAEHGTPAYVYSARQISERFQLFEAAFSHGPATRPHTICYAVKANSSLAILRLLAQQGAGFDIVSGGELERVRKAHKPALKKVVFSGVGKQIWEIDAALKAGILLFNVESEAELYLLAERAEALQICAPFALRVNPDVFAETHPYISTGLREHKFGIDITLARAIYRKAAKLKWLTPAGVSVHIGSQIRKVDPFAAALARVVSLVKDLRADGHNIRYIDAGGGLGIDYNDTLEASDFDPAQQVQNYAAALTQSLGDVDAHLLIEPGRFIVAQAGALLTRVLYVKQNGAKTFVIIDAGMNDLIRPALYQAHHEILPIRQPRADAPSITADLVGPVCESGDFFARDRALPAVKPGDLVLLLDAGAYGLSLSSNYNTRTRPPELLIETIGKGSKATLIRRRETLKDLFAQEVLSR